MAGIGIVLNPKSRANLRDPRAARRLRKTLGDHGIVREARSIDELHRIAEDFKRLDIDVLGISGGDGTNHVTLTGFIDVYQGHSLPQVAFLRGGTMNTVANSVGVRRGKPDGLLRRLLGAYAERSAWPLENVERHVLRIGDHYGFLFGTGVVYGFLAEYYRDDEPNPLVAAQTLFRGIGSTIVKGPMVKRMAAPFRGSVTLDDGTEWEERDYFSIAGGSIDQIGLNFRPFHRWGEREGAFHLLGFTTTPWGFVTQLPRIWQAKAMEPGHAFEATPKSATIRAADGKMRYMIDGDLHETCGELSVSVGPKVRIVVGV
jgi:diacylglycerol kinase family enzyme